MDTAEEIQMANGFASEIRRTQGFHRRTARVRIMRDQAAYRFRRAPGIIGNLVQMQMAVEIGGIAAGIVEASHRIDELDRSGRRRAAELTWAAAAERTLAVYRELVP